MSLTTLIYHDIEPAPTARRYAFSIADFRAHLAAIRETAAGAPVLPGPRSDLSGFALTFDDGFAGWLQAAEALEELRWKASFYIVTAAIGKAGAVGRSDIKRLAAMGHAIGTHTVDHPHLLSRREDAFIRDQWAFSKAALEDILGEEVTSGAVPGGYYDENVGRAADAAGLKYLFTSEPVTTTWSVGGCRIHGRFALVNGMSSRRVARIAAGGRLEHTSQYLAWNLKKAIKRALPGPYFALRKRMLPGVGDLAS